MYTFVNAYMLYVSVCICVRLCGLETTQLLINLTHVRIELSVFDVTVTVAHKTKGLEALAPEYFII